MQAIADAQRIERRFGVLAVSANSNLVGQKFFQRIERLGRLELAGGLEPTPERDHHQHGAPDFEINMTGAAHHRNDRIKIRSDDPHQDQEIGSRHIAAPQPEGVVQQGSAEQKQHGQTQHQAQIAKQIRQRGRQRARARGARVVQILRPQRHREHHDVERQENRESQPRQGPLRGAALSLLTGDFSGQSTPETAIGRLGNRWRPAGKRQAAVATARRPAQRTRLRGAIRFRHVADHGGELNSIRSAGNRYCSV